jgi:hypothetical protein
MALVDFNLTIETRNPDLDTGVESTGFGETVIDSWSPRWTQYLRLAYLPTSSDLANNQPTSLGGNNDNNHFMKSFGNALSFMSWSSFNQWYPGTAVVSDPTIGNEGGDALTDTGLSQYTLPFGYNNVHAQNLTWNGNFIDAVVVTDTYSTKYTGLLSQIYAQGSPTDGLFPGDALFGNGALGETNIVPRHAFAFYNASISARLVNAGDPGSLFMTYAGRSYSILGNDYLSRQRSCMWRVVPRIGNYWGSGSGAAVAGSNYKNNSFTIEVQFDKPLLHISTPFADWNFKTYPAGNTVNPYKYLTINGQAMLRYSDKTQTSIAPSVVITSPTF